MHLLATAVASYRLQTHDVQIYVRAVLISQHLAWILQSCTTIVPALSQFVRRRSPDSSLHIYDNCGRSIIQGRSQKCSRGHKAPLIWRISARLWWNMFSQCRLFQARGPCSIIEGNWTCFPPSSQTQIEPQVHHSGNTQDLHLTISKAHLQ